MDTEIKLKSIKSTRGRRFFKKKCPLINENDRSTILITNGRGGLAKEFLTDMKLLKKPLVYNYELKERISLFEDTSKLDKLFEKFNSSLFIMGSHSKKRPNNIVFGRTFDNQILDMYEFEIQDFNSMSGNKLDKFTIGSKPVLIFTDFPNDSDNMDNFYLKTLLIDMFRGPRVKNINRSGIDVCIHFQSINNEKVSMSICKINSSHMDESREVTDVIELGSCMLKIRRTQLPDSDTWKKALKKPISIKPKKQKCIEKDVFGNVYGRIHLGTEKDNYSKFVAKQFHKKLGNVKGKSQKEEEEMEVDE